MPMVSVTYFSALVAMRLDPASVIDMYSQCSQEYIVDAVWYGEGAWTVS